MREGQRDVEEQRSEGEASGAGIDAKLTRILAAVERDRQQGGIELALVIILSLTALCSTWCAYQSERWNGTQLVLLADGELSSQTANEKTLIVMQRKNLDALVLLHFMEAMQRKDQQMAEALHRRMQSPLRETVDAWLKLDPMKNPDAPPPGKMPQYVLVEDQEAKTARDKALQLRSAALQAGTNGDTYVLLTLLFASVLFFGGITGTFQSRRLRLGLGGVACGLFVLTVIRLAFMPVCRG